MAQKREPCRKEGTEWKSGIMASEDVDANQPMRETAERVGKHDIISIMPGISKDSLNPPNSVSFYSIKYIAI